MQIPNIQPGPVIHWNCCWQKLGCQAVPQATPSCLYIALPRCTWMVAMVILSAPMVMFTNFLCTAAHIKVMATFRHLLKLYYPSSRLCPEVLAQFVSCQTVYWLWGCLLQLTAVSIPQQMYVVLGSEILIISLAVIKQPYTVCTVADTPLSTP